MYSRIQYLTPRSEMYYGRPKRVRDMSGYELNQLDERDKQLGTLHRQLQAARSDRSKKHLVRELEKKIKTLGQSTSPIKNL